MARWRRRPAPVELPAWVRDPRTNDDLAHAWAEETYAGADPAVQFEVFAALLCVPRYPEAGYG